MSAPVSEFVWTAERFERAGQLGVISQQAELIKGVVYVVPPQGPAHARAVRALERAARALGDGYVVGVQLPIRLDASTEPEPDLYVAAGPESSYRDRHPAAADVQLVVEVSDSTLSFDMTQKLAVYRDHGVAEVWIVDLAGRRVLRFAGQGEPRAVTSGIIEHPSGLQVDTASLW